MGVKIRGRRGFGAMERDAGAYDDAYGGSSTGGVLPEGLSEGDGSSMFDDLSSEWGDSLEDLSTYEDIAEGIISGEEDDYGTRDAGASAGDALGSYLDAVDEEFGDGSGSTSIGDVLDEGAGGDFATDEKAAYDLGWTRGRGDALTDKPYAPPLGLVPPEAQPALAKGYAAGYAAGKAATPGGGGGTGGGGSVTPPKVDDEPTEGGMSTGTKIAIGAAAGAALIGVAVLAKKKRRRSA